MKSSRLSLYSDVQPILDSALAAGGGAYVLPSHGQAVNWRQRAYRFRKEYARVHGLSPYDQLTFPRLGDESCTVEIRINRPIGQFHAAEPDYDSAAGDLANKLFGKNVL